jgi:hypothetical protein
VNCEEAQLHLGAEPDALPAAVTEHLAGCAACQAFHRRTLAFEPALKRALELPVPERLAAPAPLARAVRPAPAVFGRWALAASLVVASVLGALLWAVRPTDSLASAVVTHVEGEPASWSQTHAVDPASVDRILAASDLHLAPGSTDVVYARSCWFRGHWVPHLVVSTGRGPVTVLVLRAEALPDAVALRSAGYQGELVPFDRGSLAVLAREAGVITPALLAQLRSALKARAEPLPP